MIGYIYLILNTVNDKTYVGQRKNADYKTDSYMGSGTLLHKAFKKYGINKFEKYLIQYCYSKEELNTAEIFWIAEYKKRGKAEYNLTKGGHSFSTIPWNKGKHYKCKSYNISDTERHNRAVRMRKLNKGRPAWNKGLKGCYKLSEETRKKISEANRGEKNHFYGKKHSDEARRKMSESHKNISEETRKKMSEAAKGRVISEGTRIKKSIAMKRLKWFNNGLVNVRREACPDGFIPGRLKK